LKPNWAYPRIDNHIPTLVPATCCAKALMGKEHQLA
jgi:hypothetical protein